MTDKREVEQGRDPVSARLLEMLYLRRKEKGWTVRDLARAAGVSPSYISLIENGHKVPDPATMERIGRALEIEPGLLNAWVTVQGRGTHVGESIEAAYHLRQSPELFPNAPVMAAAAMPGPAATFARDALELSTGPVAATELPLPARYVIGVVLAGEGREPTEAEIRDGDRRVWIDRRALPERGALRGAFAWRLSQKGLARVTGLYRRGDFVIIAPGVWAPDAIHPRQVYAVRHDGQVLLTRIAWADGRLVLLGPDSDPGATIVVDAKTEAALRRVVVGRVIVGVQRFK